MRIRQPKIIATVGFIFIALLVQQNTAHAGYREEAQTEGNLANGCLLGAGAMTLATIPIVDSAATKNPITKGAVLFAGGCAAGMAVGYSVSPANAAEAPDETELKSDDLKTLQDARDLQSE